MHFWFQRRGSRSTACCAALCCLACFIDGLLLWEGKAPEGWSLATAALPKVCNTHMRQVSSFKGCLLPCQKYGASCIAECISIANYLAKEPNLSLYIYCSVLWTCGILLPTLVFFKIVSGSWRYCSSVFQRMLFFSRRCGYCACCILCISLLHALEGLKGCLPLSQGRGASPPTARVTIHYPSQQLADVMQYWPLVEALFLAVCLASFFKYRKSAPFAACTIYFLMCAAGFRGCLPFMYEGRGASHAVVISNLGQVPLTPNLQCTTHDLLLICHLVAFSVILHDVSIAIGKKCTGHLNCLLPSAPPRR